jgi:hypothetical protein
MDSRRAKKSGALTRAVINFSSGTENQARIQKLVKRSVQKLVIIYQVK